MKKSTEAQFDDQDLREGTHTTENDETGSRTLYRKATLRRPISMHPGEMDSILELSGENLDFDNRDEDNLEPESSSDKENHVGEEASRGNRHNTVAENILGGVTVRRKSEQKNRNPLVTQMDPKIFPQEVDDKFVYNGRDKFAKLSAHAKGFLTRLLMTTDKVQGLIKTVKDTRDVLEDICKEETQSVQEKMLKENVEGHVCFISTELIYKLWGDFPGHFIVGTCI